MKRALHFATELNSRDIEKSNCFGHPPMICATATGGRECGGEVTCHEKSSTVLSEPKFGPTLPTKNCWIRPRNGSHGQLFRLH